jgi:hypothetical protein
MSGGIELSSESGCVRHRHGKITITESLIRFIFIF